MRVPFKAKNAKEEVNVDKGTPAGFSELPVTFGSGEIKLTGKILFPSVGHPVPGAILCHGLGANYQAVEPSARIIASQGVASLIFDFHGHGKSGGVFDGNMVADVIDAWHFLSGFPEVERRRIALVGHSMGAAAAVLASRKVNPYILIALSCPPEPPASWLAKPVALAWPIWTYLAGYRLHADWQAFFRALTKLSTSLRELKSCSKLFVHCRGDHLTPYQLTMKLYEKANHPKDLLLTEGGFHSAPLLSRNLRSQWTQWAVATLMN
jgi:pimeloyl-ACP methyl ester carboxylesterase